MEEMEFIDSLGQRWIPLTTGEAEVISVLCPEDLRWENDPREVWAGYLYLGDCE